MWVGIEARLRVVIAVVFFWLLSCVGFAAGPDLAREATATASESLDRMTPDKAIDGLADTRWSGIPGHNAGVWLELDWKAPVTVGEVVIRQYDRYVMQFDLQTWDGSAWVTKGHFGRAGEHMTKNVLCRIAPTTTEKLRIANITNGPSFTEVEVYRNPNEHPETVELASDLRGNFIGMVTDSLGASPVEGETVELTGDGALGQWRSRVRSDHYGVFSCRMPLSLRGTVASRLPNGFERSFPAQEFSYGLTARGIPDKVPNVLNGPWKFRLDPPANFTSRDFDDSTWSKIQVPGHWEMQGFRSLSGIGGYRRWFSVTPAPGRLKLRFDGVYSRAEIYVNGKLVATHEGGFTAFEPDITAAVQPGRNLLAVRVSEHTVVSDELDHMSQYADFPLAGILRSVTLIRVPSLHIASYTYSTHLNGDGSATISGVATILNESWKRRVLERLFISFNTMDERSRDEAAAQAATGGTNVPLGVTGPWARRDVPFSIRIRRPNLWNAERPLVGLAQLELVGDIHADPHKVGDYHHLEAHIGLRETTIRGTEILINGKPVKLRGTCHHDSDPLAGRAYGETRWTSYREPGESGFSGESPIGEEELQMKAANINVIRTSHYPPVPELADEADSLGFYVEEEADFCWVDAANDLRNAPRIIQLTAEMLARDRNHPSVFEWSLCNESDYGFDFERSHDFARAADPSRPTSAATSAWTEIATLHNPISIKRIKENEGIDKPLLFDESLCIWQGIWGDAGEMWLDPGIRDYYVEPLIGVEDAFMKSKTTQGSMIWCWKDDLFLVPGRGLEYGRNATKNHFVEAEYQLPGRGIVGDAPWGVVDGWRRPKPEFWHIKELYSPIKIAARSFPLPKTGDPIRIKVENQYDFTNLRDVKILAWVGKPTQAFSADHDFEPPRVGLAKVSADVPPRSSGEIAIRPLRALREGENLNLAFWQQSSPFVVQYTVLAAGEVRVPTPPRALPGGGLTVFEEGILAGTSTHVMGDRFELAFDKSTGALRRCVGAGQPLLLGIPELHVLPTANCFGAIEDVNPAKIEHLMVRREGSRIGAGFEATFGAFAGHCKMSISPTGEVTVETNYVNNGPDVLAREIGIRLSLPRDCKKLIWDRNAEWTVYPPQHIGRPHGSAIAFPPPLNVRTANWSWNEDPSPMGCNDFRSTKRHVNWIWLGPAGRRGLAVIADGKQSARATVLSDRVSLCISDWYGGSNVGLGEWVSNYGSGKVIKHGETVSSHLVLRLGAAAPQTTSSASAKIAASDFVKADQQHHDASMISRRAPSTETSGFASTRSKTC